MLEQLMPLTLKPGYFNNGTKYQAKDRWFTGTLVRFFEGALRPIGGWSALSFTGATIVGRPVAAIAYQQLSGDYYTVVGTTSNLYAVNFNSATSVYTVYDITPTTLASGFDSLTWTLAVFGNYVLANYRAEGPPDNAAPGAGGDDFCVWDGNPAHVADDHMASMDRPTHTLATFATPEKFAVVLGAVDRHLVLTGTSPDPRLVWWASQATTDIWVPSGLNSAGSFSLATPGVLMAGTAFRGQSLLWTTRDLWSMQYVGQPLIYGFQQLGLECGLYSSRAYVVASNAVFWMGLGRFYRFDGFVSPLQCDVADYVFSNMHADYPFKTWALHNPQFNEVTWFYVSKTAPTNTTTGVVEVDSYVTYNYTENHWVFGALSRSCGMPAQPPGLVPVLASPEGVFYQHETGNYRGGLYANAESGPIEIGQGDQVMRIQQIVPDDKTVGDVSITLYASLFPDSGEWSTGTVPISATTKPTSVRILGRQVRLAISEFTAADWRVGTIRLGVIPGSRR